MASLLTMPSSDSETSSDDGENWNEVVDEDAVETVSPTKGLFSDQLFETAEDALKNAMESHGFDLLAFIRDLPSSDIYVAIKVVNFLRAQVQASIGSNCGWFKEATKFLNISDDYMDEKYLVSTIPDDPLVLYIMSWSAFLGGDGDSEDDEGDLDAEEESDAQLQALLEQISSAKPGAMEEDAMGTDIKVQIVESEGPSKLVARARALQIENERITKENDALKKLVRQCRGLMTSIAMKDEENATSSASVAVVGSDAKSKSPGQDNDTYYFDSYSHIGIHETMLKDKSRTEAYRDAIYKNPKLFENKVVLDVGCGTGILSMFAARAGAKHVIGVDMSDMAFKAKEIVKLNHLEDVITIIHGKVENISLPPELGVDKVDLIVSEWMGYALVYECMLETVLCARDQWLAPNGVMFPNLATVYVGGLSDEAMWTSQVNYWEDVYGFDMSCMKKKNIDEADVFVVDHSSVSTDMVPVWNLDIQSIRPADLDLKTSFSLTVETPGKLTGLIITFDCTFSEQCENVVVLKTGSDSTPTHWKQTVLHLKAPSAHLTAGTIVQGDLIIRRNEKNPRYLDFEVVFHAPMYGNGFYQKYVMQ